MLSLRHFFSIQKMPLFLIRELVSQEVLPDPILWGLLLQPYFQAASFQSVEEGKLEATKLARQ